MSNVNSDNSTKQPYETPVVIIEDGLGLECDMMAATRSGMGNCKITFVEEN